MNSGQIADKRRQRVGRVWPILAFILLSPLSSVSAPIVTIIDDDARSERAIEAVKAVADRCKIKVTFAVVASGLEKRSGVLKQLRQYAAEGHEVASHSLTHRPGIWNAGAATDIRAIEREVVEADKIFRRLGFHTQAFVYPYGNFPSGVRHDIFEVVGRYYPVAFNARGDINLPGKTYPLYVSRHPLRSHNSMLMTKRLIDEAVTAGNAWIVILTHSGNYDFSAEMLESVIRYAQKSGAVFLPASAAWRQVSSWPMMREDQIPEYSLLGDCANAAYFHLPLMLIAGIVLIALAGGVTYVWVLRRRIGASAQRRP